MRSLFHEGYVDGMLGNDPVAEKCWSGSEYEDGWLVGSEARERGEKVPKFFGYCPELPVTKGDRVTIPKGTKVFSTGGIALKEAGHTYKVTVHRTDHGTDAHRNWHGEFVPARNPCVVWVGGGSYWHEADLNSVIIEK